MEFELELELASADLEEDDGEKSLPLLFWERGAFPARLGTADNMVVVVFVVVVDWDDDARRAGPRPGASAWTDADGAGQDKTWTRSATSAHREAPILACLIVSLDDDDAVAMPFGCS